MLTILIVEDNHQLCSLYSVVLEKAGFNTVMAGDGAEAFTVMENTYVDLIITDIMMPNMDGYEFVSSVREVNPEIPILMITAKDDFYSKNRGFGTGADDYMVKPIDVKEMVLRVNALFRRSRAIHEHRQKLKDTELEYDSLTVTARGETITLPKKEFYLLYKLASSPNKIFTRRQLMDEIWGPDSDSDEQTVDVHINRLRKKLGSNPDFKIVTVRGLGYKITI